MSPGQNNAVSYTVLGEHCIIIHEQVFRGVAS